MIRGEIYWAVLAPRSGSERSGRGPVLVVSHDSLNSVQSWRSIIVVPISTSEKQLRRGHTAIVIPKDTAGLSKTSVVLCHQVTTLDRSKIKIRIGILPPQLLRQVEEGLIVALDLDIE